MIPTLVGISNVQCVSSGPDFIGILRRVDGILTPPYVVHVPRAVVDASSEVRDYQDCGVLIVSEAFAAAEKLDTSTNNAVRGAFGGN